MEIEISTVGGYEEIGRQMTAVRAGEEVVIFDMGLHLSEVLLHDNVETEEMHSLDLIDLGAIPDDRIMSEINGEVSAIVPTHGHLDHIGALSKLAHRYDAPIVGTEFTIELVKKQVHQESKFEVDNDLVKLGAGDTMTLDESGDLELEFVNVTHSIPQAINPVLHTPEGAIVYGLDKRIDHNPVLGDPFNMDRFKEIANNEGVLCYFEDCTNAGKKGRTPSENVARTQLKDVMSRLEDYDGGIVATTFSSHVARIKSIVEFAREIDREPILLGRSMKKYGSIADRIGIVDFTHGLEMQGHRGGVEEALERIMEEGKDSYLPVVTGHQGEPHAMLTRMSRDRTPFEFEEGDKVIFSARIIPEPINVGQRHQVENLLRKQGVRIYDDVHVSGHLRQEGLYEMLNTLNPDHLVPAHNDMGGYNDYVDMAENAGYTVGEDLHVSRNGQRFTIVED
jgi:ribonuclease J